jgi:DNA recombination protein RmuC
MTEILIAVVFGILAGAVIAYFVLNVLNRARNVSRADYEELNSRLNDANTLAIISDKDLMRVRDECASFVRKFEAKEADASLLRAQIAASETMLDNEKRKNADVILALSEQSAANDAKQREINELNRKYAEEKAAVALLSEKLDRQEKVNAKQTDDISGLNEKLRVVSSENSTLAANNRALDENSKSLKSRVVELESQAKTLAETVSRFDSENSALKANNASLDENGKSLRSRVVELEAQAKTLAETVSRFDSENSAFKANNASLDENCKSLRSRAAELEAQTKTLSETLSRFDSENSALKANNASLDENCKSFRSRVAELETQTKTLSETVSRFDSENSALKANNASLDETGKSLKSRVSEMETRIRTLEEQNLQLHSDNSTLTAKNNSLAELLDLQKKEVVELQKSAHLQFEKIANQIFEEKSGRFTETNKANIEALLKPLGENIDSFKRKVEETYEKESILHVSLESKVKDLVEQTNKVSSEANNLASALKGQAKRQGNWGEMILESILQHSGLVRDREYHLQYGMTDEEGKNLRPDVVVNLPDNRAVIIDSKVSLTAYDRYASAESAEEQNLYMKEHLKSIRSHIDELSAKKYDNLETSLDFTMMFIPVEPAYIAAIQNDDDLWRDAYVKRILLISPTNLIACLRLINDLWKREMQSRNAKEIVNIVTSFYDKFAIFADTFEKVGRQLEQTRNSYDTAKTQFSSGRGNLVGRVLKLKALGINPKKEIAAADQYDEVEHDEVAELLPENPETV